MRAFVFAMALFLIAPGTVDACPWCATDTGRQVQAAIFDDNFWRHAGVVLLPLAVLLVIAAALHFGLPQLSQLRPKARIQPGDEAVGLRPQRTSP